MFRPATRWFSRTTLCGAMALAAFAAVPHAGVGWLEMESFLPLKESVGDTDGDDGVERAIAVTWVVGYPDTLAATDTRAILASLAPDQGQPLLPRGTLSAHEEAFIVGLRAFLDNNPRATVAAWQRLRAAPLSPRLAPGLSPELAASIRVNLAVLLALRGEHADAEQAWLREWNRRPQSASRGARDASPAAEGAWRNLIALYMAQNRWGDAGARIREQLDASPRHRLALLAEAALLWQTRPEAEWAEYLRRRATEDSAAPDMQLLYAEHLLRRGGERATRADLELAVQFFDRALEKNPGAGRGWFLLAETQFRLGYYYFALDCLQNAARGGYTGPDFHELYARVLYTCCTGDEDPRATRARTAAQDLLEKGLVKDLHRRSAAQLLHTLYAQNLKPDAAEALKESMWFHFTGPRQDVPRLGDPLWTQGRSAPLARPGALVVKPGMYGLTWILAMRDRDVYRAEL